MDDLGIPATGMPLVAWAPPAIVRHQTADWSAIRADNVEGVRHEAFGCVFKSTSRHLLIAAERALSIALAYELIRMNESVSPVVSCIRGGLPNWQQNKLTQYIDEHLAEDISLSSLAELVHLSPYHFSRAFKQSFNMPPHRYLTNRRIEAAKSLLANRKLSVTEIGLDIGFSETSSFTSAFRKVTGETPTDYRRSVA